MKKLEYKVIDNFLDEEFYLQLKKSIEDPDFPWRARMSDPYVDKGYFTHSIFHTYRINSFMYENSLVPILDKLEARSIIKASFHMFLTELFKKNFTEYHQDCPYNCNSAVLNFTNCNGGTQLKIKDKEINIESKENRMVIFNSLINHRTIKHTDSDSRFILNINYF